MLDCPYLSGDQGVGECELEGIVLLKRSLLYKDISNKVRLHASEQLQHNPRAKL